MLVLLVASLALFGAGAAAALVFTKEPEFCRRLSHGLAFFGSAFVLVLGALGAAGSSFEVVVPGLLPLAGGLSLGIDRISAFFLLVIAAAALPASMHAVGYTRRYEGRHSSLGVLVNLLIPSMVLTILARNVLTFLFCAEIVSLCTYFLVMTESAHPETRRSGWLSMVVAHAGLACLLVGTLAMSGAASSFDMAAWAGAAGEMSAGARNAVFLVTAAGFLIMSGAVPVRSWLPAAHAAAPSHVSAILSSASIKIGIYGLVRIGFDWLGTGPAWWGAVLVAAGAAAAVLGTSQALSETDLKRVLASSSTGSIGVILLGIGAGIAFRGHGAAAAASLALLAALGHTLNHALMKSLLFLGSGSVLQSAGTRDMEEMGGLVRRMPHTAVLFLAGCLAMSGLPPFNGFTGYWLTLQSLLAFFLVPDRVVKLVFAVGIGALALAAGFAAACFVRAFGIAFLALPRGKTASNAHEADWTMRLGMLVPAAMCVVSGLFPSAVFGPASAAVTWFLGVEPDLSAGWTTLSTARDAAAIAPFWVAVVLVAAMLAVWLLLRVSNVNLASRRYETWGGGRALQSSGFQQTATAFAHPLRFARGSSGSALPNGAAVRHGLAAAWAYAAAWARRFRYGDIHGYLLYVFLVLLVLLLTDR